MAVADTKDRRIKILLVDLDAVRYCTHIGLCAACRYGYAAARPARMDTRSAGWGATDEQLYTENRSQLQAQYCRFLCNIVMVMSNRVYVLDRGKILFRQIRMICGDLAVGVPGRIPEQVQCCKPPTLLMTV